MSVTPNDRYVFVRERVERVIDVLSLEVDAESAEHLKGQMAVLYTVLQADRDILDDLRTNMLPLIVEVVRLENSNESTLANDDLDRFLVQLGQALKDCLDPAKRDGVQYIICAIWVLEESRLSLRQFYMRALAPQTSARAGM